MQLSPWHSSFCAGFVFTQPPSHSAPQHLVSRVGAWVVESAVLRPRRGRVMQVLVYELLRILHTRSSENAPPARKTRRIAKILEKVGCSKSQLFATFSRSIRSDVARLPEGL